MHWRADAPKFNFKTILEKNTRMGHALLDISAGGSPQCTAWTRNLLLILDLPCISALKRPSLQIEKSTKNRPG